MLQQERIVYQPFPQDFATCPALAEAERVTFNGTRMYMHATTLPVAVLYHGNAGSACDRALYANLFTSAGYGYILVEYAGYSNDPEPPSHERIKLDARNVISFMQASGIDARVVVGESIGTGVAAYHASLYPPEKLLLIAPFTNLIDVARTRFWFYPSSLLVNNAFDLSSALEAYPGSVRIIHGTSDTIIPFELGQALYDSLATEKELLPITNADHNNLCRFPETTVAITSFLIHSRSE